jgi:hypothetical protein
MAWLLLAYVFLATLLAWMRVEEGKSIASSVFFGIFWPLALALGTALGAFEIRRVFLHDGHAPKSILARKLAARRHER